MRYILLCEIMLLLLRTARSTFSLETEYSRLSGLVFNIGVGSDPQPLRVGLEFKQDLSVIFSGLACGAFLPSCFSPDRSETFAPSPTQDQIASDRAWMGGKLVPNFTFEHRTRHATDELESIEVGGYISMTKKSEFLIGASLVLEAHETGVRLSETADAVPSDPAWDVLSSDESKWDFSSALAINSVTVFSPTGFVFDPTIQDIVIPVNVWESVNIYLKSISIFAQVDDTGLVYFPCSEVDYISPGFTLSLQFPGNRHIAIPFTDLLFPPETALARRTAAPSFCPARIRVSQSSNAVVIGRQLLRAVSGIVLNYGSNTIAFYPLTSETMRPLDRFPVPIPLVPVFSDPLILTESIRFNPIDASFGNGLLLTHKLPRRVPGITGASCWTFLRLNEGYPHVSQSLIEGFFNEATLFIVGSSLIIEHGPPPVEGQPGLQIVIVSLPDRLEVRVIERTADEILVPISQLELPAPEPFQATESQSAVECSICLSALSAGEPSQRIEGCNRVFHFRCVKEWLETRAQTCPCCRRCVKRRSFI